MLQINAHAMTNALSPESRPWVVLGRKLGQVAAGLNPGNVENMQVTTYGIKRIFYYFLIISLYNSKFM